MMTYEERQLGRAKNAVLEFLEQRLSVPKIYIDATWDGHPVDILAINRDGVGDVHVVLLFPRHHFVTGERNGVDQGEAVTDLVEKLSSIPAQFKYIAAVQTSAEDTRPFRPSNQMSEMLLSPDGLGRIGFLTIEAPMDGDPQVRLEIKPERFRAAIAKLADEYIQKHEADWEIRA